MVQSIFEMHFTVFTVLNGGSVDSLEDPWFTNLTSSYVLWVGNCEGDILHFLFFKLLVYLVRECLKKCKTLQVIGPRLEP